MSSKRKFPFNDWNFSILIPPPKFLDKDRHTVMMLEPNQNKVNINATRYLAATKKGFYLSVSNEPRICLLVWLQIFVKVIINWFIDYGEYFKLKLPPGTQYYKL